jgi:hypothetical protein
VVVFLVLDPHPTPVLDDCTVARYPVRHTGEKFRQMERRVGIMPDPEKKYLSVQFVYSPDRTLWNVRGEGERIGDDPGGLGPRGTERLEVIAS